MQSQNISHLTDQELQTEIESLKSYAILNAFLIGFLFGIVVFSLVFSAFGWLMLLPLYLAHLFIQNPKAKRLRALKAEQKLRKQN